MRIVSWNCNGKFREKISQIVKLNADVYVIQESENPKNYPNMLSSLLEYCYLWCGDRKNKGLLVFSKLPLQENHWKKYCLREFLSVNVGDINLVAVWACSPYIEEYYIYHSINLPNYCENTVIIGDLNSNAMWDTKYNKRNHTNVVKELKEKGLVSAYHYLTGEQQGKESKSTFYLYRKENRGYFIDHCFISPSKLQSIDIMGYNDWVKYSDHVPIEVELK